MYVMCHCWKVRLLDSQTPKWNWTRIQKIWKIPDLKWMSCNMYWCPVYFCEKTNRSKFKFGVLFEPEYLFKWKSELSQIITIWKMWGQSNLHNQRVPKTRRCQLSNCKSLETIQNSTYLCCSWILDVKVKSMPFKMSAKSKR